MASAREWLEVTRDYDVIHYPSEESVGWDLGEAFPDATPPLIPYQRELDGTEGSIVVSVGPVSAWVPYLVVVRYCWSRSPLVGAGGRHFYLSLFGRGVLIARKHDFSI